MVKRMMMIALALQVCLNSIGQEINWGAIQEAQKAAITKSFIPVKGSFYIVKTISTKKQKGIYLEKYDAKSLKQIHNGFFANPAFANTNITFERVEYFNNQLVWFVSGFNRVERKHTLYKVAIDSALTKAQDPIMVDAYDIGASKSIPGYGISESEDNKYFLIARKFPFDKYANEQYHFILCDSVMKEKWSKDIEIPYPNNLLEITEKLIDKQGNLHLLATLAPEKQKGDFFNRSVASNKYLLISYYAAENKLKEFEINLDGKYITSVTAGIGPNGNIAIGGFYSNSNTFTLAGTFYLTISPQSKKVISLNQKPFEKEFLMEFMSERSVNKGEELNDFYFDHFILNEDGSAILVAEEYFRQTYTYFDPYNQLYYDNNTYNFNAVIVVKVDVNGEISWTKKISKRQISSTGYNEFFSYALGKGKEKLYVIFNDHSSNLRSKTINDENVYALTHHKYAVPVLVTINGDGAATKDLFFKEDRSTLALLPALCQQLDEENYLLCRQRKRNIQFGILKLK